MKYFLDTEFIEAGPSHPLVLLSVGIVAEDGREFYAVNDQANLINMSDWVRDNVMPHLGNFTMSFDAIRRGVENFVNDTPEFWGYYADYDWVIFCQIFGSMIDLPKGWPRYCRDIKQLCDSAGNPKLPAQISTEHNALHDAKWNKIAYEFLLERAIAESQAPDAFKQHADHVQQFLNDLWAFSIDPLHDGMAGLKVAEVCTALLKAAKNNRDSVYELDGLFRTASKWVWKGLDAPGQTLESTMEAMRQEYKKENAELGDGEPSPPPQDWAEKWAKDFHDTYERSAPQFGYETRKDSAKPWAEVPENNRKLMIAVCAEVLCRFEKWRVASGAAQEVSPPSPEFGRIEIRKRGNTSYAYLPDREREADGSDFLALLGDTRELKAALHKLRPFAYKAESVDCYRCRECHAQGSEFSKIVHDADCEVGEAERLLG